MAHKIMRRAGLAFGVLFFLLGTALKPAHAEPPVLDVELNALKPAAGSCQLAFVFRNGLPADITSLAMEIVLFDRGGIMQRVLRLKASALPAKSMRFKMFAIPGVECVGLGNVLLNDIPSCELATTDTALDKTACAAAIRASHKTDVPLTR
ncbi:MAG: hypothetical protein AAGJ70_07170 [Pseudomonadota bacterium]